MAAQGRDESAGVHLGGLPCPGSPCGPWERTCFKGSVPDVVVSWTYVIVPSALTFGAGYLAKHTNRPDGTVITVNATATPGAEIGKQVAAAMRRGGYSAGGHSRAGPPPAVRDRPGGRRRRCLPPRPAGVTQPRREPKAHRTPTPSWTWRSPGLRYTLAALDPGSPGRLKGTAAWATATGAARTPTSTRPPCDCNCRAAWRPSATRRPPTSEPAAHDTQEHRDDRTARCFRRRRSSGRANYYGPFKVRADGDSREGVPLQRAETVRTSARSPSRRTPTASALTGRWRDPREHPELCARRLPGMARLSRRRPHLEAGMTSRRPGNPRSLQPSGGPLSPSWLAGRGEELGHVSL